MTREEQRVPGVEESPPVRVLTYTPRSAADRLRPAMLHIHGGGYVMGSPEFSDVANIGWAAELGAVVVSVDYRLAPEHPFPAPLDDCFAALLWLFAQAKNLGVDPRRVAVAGESAGGGLAAALAQRARDAQLPPLALQMLAAPMLDPRTGALSSPPSIAGEFMWRAQDNRFGWGAYLRGGDAAASAPYAVPGLAHDLRGLAPAFISVGALDLFLDENLDYGRRLVAAGVPVELHVHPGGVHAFDLMPDTRIGSAYARERRDALRRAFRLDDVHER